MQQPEERGISRLSCLGLHLVPPLLAVEYRVRLQEFSFTLSELCVPLLMLIAALSSAGSKTRLPRTFLVAAGAMSVAGFLGVLLQSDLKHNLSVYRDLMLPMVFYGAFLSVRLRPAQALQLAKAYIFWTTLSSVLAMVQFYTEDYLWFQVEDTAIWQDLKAGLAAESGLGQVLGVGKILPMGFCCHPNNFAAYVVISALVSWALVRTAGAGGLERWWWGVCTVVQLTALVHTFSRSSFLTFLGGAIAFELLVARERRPRTSLVVASAAATAAACLLAVKSEVFSFDDLGTLVGRMDMLRAGVSLLSAQPLAILTGGLTEIYMNTFYLFGQLVHNVFLYLILQFGIVTMVAWLAMMLTEMRRIGAAVFARAGGERRVGGAVLVGLFFTVFFYGETYSLLDSVQIGLWLSFWMGLCVQLTRAGTAWEECA